MLLRDAEAAGLQTVPEGFADPAYADDGTLVPRDQPHAVLTQPEAVAAQAIRLAPSVASICLHGDTDHAVELARWVRTALATAGVDVRPFTYG